MKINKQDMLECFLGDDAYKGEELKVKLMFNKAWDHGQEDFDPNWSDMTYPPYFYGYLTGWLNGHDNEIEKDWADAIQFLVDWYEDLSPQAHKTVDPKQIAIVKAVRGI